MENTIENKEKFFAQYWGQKVLRYGFVDWDSLPVYKVGKSELIDIYRNSDDASFESYLELTPLSQITDEDAIEVMKIMKTDPKEAGFDKSWQKLKEELKTANSIVVLSLFDFYGYLCHAIDYLRSKSYAIEWMGLSVEELIEFGWIRLKKSK